MLEVSPADIPMASLPLEPVVNTAVQWLRLGVEAIGALIVTVGVVAAIWSFLGALLQGEPTRYNRIRLTLARYLVVGLEFQLAADILSTAIAPSWNQIGKLGAIAVIRTTLNFFLIREMREEQKALNPSLLPGEQAQSEHLSSKELPSAPEQHAFT